MNKEQGISKVDELFFLFVIPDLPDPDWFRTTKRSEVALNPGMFLSKRAGYRPLAAASCRDIAESDAP